MKNNRYRVFVAGEDDYQTFNEGYHEAHNYAKSREKDGFKVSIVETVMSGRRKGSEWTVYHTGSSVD